MIRWARTAFLLLSVFLVPFSQASLGASEQTFRVGAAKVDITPSEPVVLAGYGSRGAAPYDGIDTKLWARALAIRGEAWHVVIAVDNCGVPAAIVEAVYARVNERHPLDRAGFVVCSTHTHNAPSLPGYAPILWQERVGPNEIAASQRYASSLTDKLVSLAERVLSNHVEARLDWGQGHVSFGGNRRILNDGKWGGFGYQRDGPVDPSVPTLVARDVSDTVIAVWSNYACHCTTLGAVNRVSGDWAGFANDELERRFPQAAALTTIGCGADVGPQPSGNATLARQHGESLAAEVERLIRAGPGKAGGLTPVSADLSSRELTIRLPFLSTHERRHWQARAKLRGFDGVHGREMLRQWEHHGRIASGLDYRLSAWRFGNELAIVFLPGEVCVDFALRLKTVNDPTRLWINGWSNDVPCYVPSKRVLDEGGYEADFSMTYYGHPSRFDDSVEERIVSGASRLLGPEFRAAAAPRDESAETARKPIPDKLVVLTFDDCNRSDLTVVAPELEKHGFGATFYFTRGLGADKDHENFLTWEECKQLDQRGFEIGNHTKTHAGVAGLNRTGLREEVGYIQRECKQRGITPPTTFCFPGFGHTVEAVRVLDEEGFLFARRGVRPEFQDGGKGSRGPAYDPAVDHPLLIPTTGYDGPDWGMDDLRWALDQGRDGRIVVLCFHGVPAVLHPWVSSDPEDFKKYMQLLRDEHCRVIAVRDLVQYVDPNVRPADPYEPIRRRMNK